MYSRGKKEESFFRKKKKVTFEKGPRLAARRGFIPLDLKGRQNFRGREKRTEADFHALEKEREVIPLRTAEGGEAPLKSHVLGKRRALHCHHMQKPGGSFP